MENIERYYGYGNVATHCQREKSPIYTLGCPNARSFSRGKRAIAGGLSFFAFDHDAFIEAMKRQWDKIAPPAMYTAAGNISNGKSESFIDALDTVRWNMKTTDDVKNAFKNPGFGFQGDHAISPNDPVPGSNNKPYADSSGYFVGGFNKADSEILVPPGFEPIRGENIAYADTIPPCPKLTN